MEVKEALVIYHRWESTQNVRYSKYLNDGDNKRLKGVESKAYGDNANIAKVECVGHVQKRMGSRLFSLKKELKGEEPSN